MRIAVFGSWKERHKNEWRLKGSLEEFANACRSLGAEIARRGHVMIVGSVSQETADVYIVEGAVGIAQSQSFNRPVIEALRPNDGTNPYESEAKKFPQLFAFRPFTAPDWETAHLLAIREADSVLIIGGARSSYHAGIAAVISRKRAVPIGSFGGAGLRLLDVLESMGESLRPGLPAREELGLLRRPWTEAQLNMAVNLLGLRDFPRLLIIHGRSQDWRDLKDYLQNRLLLPEPVVMSQQFGQGRTLPEKFEQLAFRVDGAIAVVTPDDIGAVTIDDVGQLVPEGNRDYHARARQNVWIEVGWFWGNLGRRRVLLLRRGNVEIPSDLQGVEQQVYRTCPSEAAEAIRSFIEHIRGASTV